MEKSPVIEQHSGAYEEYDDQYVDTYSSAKGSSIHQKMQDIHLDDDLPDTTMLDSVVLPAIASVSGCIRLKQYYFYVSAYLAISKGFIPRGKGCA